MVLNQQQIATMLQLAADGETVRKICAAVGISTSALYECLRADRELGARYASAREQGADTMVDEMIDTARDEGVDVNRARLIVDAIKWTASKRKPQTYGDKLDLNVSGNVDLTAIMAESAARLRPMRDPITIDQAPDPVKSIACAAESTDCESASRAPAESVPIKLADLLD